MKVLLINPPRFNEIIGNNPSIIEEERGYNPPLGILHVAAYLRENSDHDIKIIDAQVEELQYDDLESKIREFAPDVTGITVMTLTLLDALQTSSIVKKTCKECRVVMGGPHVHLFPDETIAFDSVDFLVLGEGEIVFKDLLDHIHDPDRLKSVPGLVYANGKEVVHTGRDPLISDLDLLPFPARDLVPVEKYSSILAKRTPITTSFTSRGCPYKCTFCDRPHLGKKFRARSPLNVIEEMEECLDMGIHEFLIYDDTFTVDKKRVIEICKEICDRNLDVGFDIRARVNTIDENLLIWLKKANCRGIHYGIEAGTERLLKVINKGIHLDQAKEVFDLTRKHKIQTLAYFMIGLPSETREDITETFRVAKWLNPDFLHMTILTPFPGTQIYFDALEKGIIKTDVWREFSKNPSKDFIPPIWEENFTKEELQNLLIEGYKKFYTRPSYIVKKMVQVKSMGEFKRKAKAGLKVLFMQKSEDSPGD